MFLYTVAAWVKLTVLILQKADIPASFSRNDWAPHTWENPRIAINASITPTFRLI
jgi:hypothetical protein